MDIFEKINEISFEVWMDPIFDFNERSGLSIATAEQQYLRRSLTLNSLFPSVVQMKFQ